MIYYNGEDARKHGIDIYLIKPVDIREREGLLMNEKQDITTKNYKVKVAILSILILTAFVAKEVIDYKYYYNIIVAVGGDTSDFFLRFIGRYKWAILAGIIVMILPYERMYEKFRYYVQIFVRISSKGRRFVIFIVTFIPTVAVLPFCGMFDRYTYILFLICNTGMLLIISLCIAPLFESAFTWLSAVMIYGILNLSAVYYRMYNTISMTVYEIDSQKYWTMQVRFGFVVLLYVVLMIAILFYSFYVVDKSRDITNLIVNTIFGCTVSIMAWYFIGSEFKIGYMNIPNLKEIKSASQQIGDGIYAFSMTSFVTILLLCVIIASLMFIGAKLVNRYSHFRMAVMMWSGVLMTVFLIWEVMEHLGFAENMALLDPVFDVGLVVTMFVAIRTMILTAEPSSGIECKFIDKDEMIEDLDMYNHIREAQMDCTNKTICVLINYIKLLELRHNVLEAKFKCKNLGDIDETREYREYIRIVEDVIEKKRAEGKPVDHNMLFDRIDELNTEEEENIKEIINKRFDDDDMIDEDEVDFEDESFDQCSGSGTDVGRGVDLDNRSNGEVDIRENYHKLTQLLISRHLTITTMESATSGQIASLITDTEGSSAVLKGAFVTYCNEAKIMQGIPAEIIDKYTVYSKETAGAMAKACRKAYNANIGIGVTGTMGNVDPANPNASVPGQVYFAIDIDGDVEAYYVEIPVQPTRLAYKLAVAEEIYEELVKRLV